MNMYVCDGTKLTFFVSRTDSIESKQVIQFVDRIIYDVPISLDAKGLVLQKCL